MSWPRKLALGTPLTLGPNLDSAGTVGDFLSGPSINGLGSAGPRSTIKAKAISLLANWQFDRNQQEKLAKRWCDRPRASALNFLSMISVVAEDDLRGWRLHSNRLKWWSARSIMISSGRDPVALVRSVLRFLSTPVAFNRDPPCESDLVHVFVLPSFFYQDISHMVAQYPSPTCIILIFGNISKQHPFLLNRDIWIHFPWITT